MNQLDRLQARASPASHVVTRPPLRDAAAHPSAAARALISAYWRATEGSVGRLEPLLFPIGLCGAFGMPVYYFIWTQLFPQAYENLSLRLVGAVLCLLMAAKPVWPTALRPYLGPLWHLCLLYCIPFFFTFMLLMNQGSPVWLVTWLCGFFMMVVMVTWINLVLLLVIGILTASAAYQVVAPLPADYGWLWEQVPVFLFALIAGTLSSYRRGIAQTETFSAIALIGRNLARELAGPLRSITAAVVSLKQYLPVLLHDQPADAGQGSRPTQAHLQTLEEIPARIQVDIQRATALVQMLAGNTEDVDFRSLPRTRLTIAECMRQALRRFPFSSDAERRIVRWHEERDFPFIGHQDAIVRALMNVLKAALQTAVRSGRGEISFAVVPGVPMHRFTLSLTGSQVSSRVNAQVFDVQSVLEAGSGTGPGLFAAKRIIEAHGGELTCRGGEAGEIHFEFKFPSASP